MANIFEKLMSKSSIRTKPFCSEKQNHLLKVGLNRPRLLIVPFFMCIIFFTDDTLNSVLDFCISFYRNFITSLLSCT